MSNRMLTTYGVAEYCQATPQWITENPLKAYRTLENHSRVAIEEFLSFLETYSMPVPPKLKFKVNDYAKNRIFIVDDDPGMASFIQRFLEEKRIRF